MAVIASTISGNFNSGLTWVGGVVPTTGDEADISNLTTVTLTADVTLLAELRILAGGTLAGGGYKVTLTTGTGNTGIFVNSGTISGNFDLTIASASGKSISNSATGNVRNLVIDCGAGETVSLGTAWTTTTSTTLTTGTISCGANAFSSGSGVATTTHTLNGNGGNFSGGSGSHTIGNITIGNAGSTLTLTSGTTTLDGYNTSSAAGCYMGAPGTFTHNSGTINCTYAGNASFWKNAGDGIFTFYNLSNGASNTLKFASQAAVTYTVANNLTINGTMNTRYTGTEGAPWVSVGVTITGDLDMNGTFTANVGTVTFNKVGTSICAMNGESFYNLNCSGSTQVNITENCGILTGGKITPSTGGKFVMTSGKIITLA